MSSVAARSAQRAGWLNGPNLPDVLLRHLFDPRVWRMLPVQALRLHAIERLIGLQAARQQLQVEDVGAGPVQCFGRGPAQTGAPTRHHGCLPLDAHGGRV